jgi:hypothetical protein
MCQIHFGSWWSQYGVLTFGKCQAGGCWFVLQPFAVIKAVRFLLRNLFLDDFDLPSWSFLCPFSFLCPLVFLLLSCRYFYVYIISLHSGTGLLLGSGFAWLPWAVHMDCTQHISFSIGHVFMKHMSWRLQCKPGRLAVFYGHYGWEGTWRVTW